MDPSITRAREVIRLAQDALERLQDLLDASFLDAVREIHACEGRVVITGMGKAGLVARKMSATLASTGTPSLWLHPAEARHGDLGRISSDDVVIAFSNSGETEELTSLLPSIRRIGARLIAVTGQADSTLALEADLVLSIGALEEAGPMGLAPTTSSTAMMVLGDALAMAVLDARGFTPEEYAANHPGGSLGRRLMRVSEVMRHGESLPLAGPAATVRDAAQVMTSTPGRPGAVLIVDEDGPLLGIFTDGDMRRAIVDGDPMDRAVTEVMGTDPRTVGPEALVAEAERLLHENHVDQVPVVDGDGRPVGLLDIQDLFGRK